MRQSCRAMQNSYLPLKICVDTAENEPLEVWGENSIHYSLHSLGSPPTRSRCPPRVRRSKSSRFPERHVLPLGKGGAFGMVFFEKAFFSTLLYSTPSYSGLSAIFAHLCESRGTPGIYFFTIEEKARVARLAQVFA